MRTPINRECLTPGQLAKRWGCDPSRVHALIRTGKLEAFTIPAAGRFGQAIKIPMAAVLAAEKDWTMLPIQSRPRPPRDGQKFKHLRPRDGEV